MSVPLDRLYNFLHDVSDHDVVIYRWTPHGSRKKEHCQPLVDVPTCVFQQLTQMYMICHDQEPLNFDNFGSATDGSFDIPGVPYSQLRNLVRIVPWMLHDQIMFCHSERNSQHVEKFEQSGAVGVYYWSHALIARDWFRYAELDPSWSQPKTLTNLFLIYNRSWSGCREYRLKFTEMVMENNLIDCSVMRFNPNDSGIHYVGYCYQNPRFRVQQKNWYQLEQQFALNDSSSTASADYEGNDYRSTAIEVVLETLFDDTRWHLTEKTLRPIACGQPFILAATAGSLKYLHSYGFQTFDSVWDESYDDIKDPVARLQAIVDLMQHIKLNYSTEEILDKTKKICEHNQQRFFSQQFTQLIIDEYRSNVNHAVTVMKQHARGTFWLAHMRDIQVSGGETETGQVMMKVFRWLQEQKTSQ